MNGAVSVVQMVLSLTAVVAVILVMAWMTRRMQGLRASMGSDLRVRATLAVGMKERVILIEAAGRQFLIGVAPGRVNLIDALGPAPDEVAIAGEPGNAAPPQEPDTRPSFRDAFAQQLGSLLRR